MKPKFERLSSWSCMFASLFELCHWLAAGFAFVLAVASAWMGSAFFPEVAQTLWGISPPVPAAVLSTYFLYAVTFVCAVLMAKTWRYVRKVFETSAGHTPSSIGPTPFQPENIRLLKKIASYSILAQLINAAYFLARIFIAAFASGSAMSIFTDATKMLSCITGLVFGLIVFCLAHFFAYGIQLQLDTDGLV